MLSPLTQWLVADGEEKLRVEEASTICNKVARKTRVKPSTGKATAEEKKMTFDYTRFINRNRRGQRDRRKRSSKSPWDELSADDPDEYGVASESPRRSLAETFQPRKRKREKVVVDNSHFESMPICGVEVRFPAGVKPYPSQKLMMVRMITSLAKRLNLLAESPTGSGKTLALLASSCAWLDNYRKNRVQARALCPLHGEGSGTLSNTTTQGFHDLERGDGVKLEAEEVLKLLENTELFVSVWISMPLFRPLSSCERRRFIAGAIFLRKPFSVAVWSTDDGNHFEQECTIQSSDACKKYQVRNVYMSTICNQACQLIKTDPAKEASCAKIEQKPACTCLPRTRIYYGTRTHKQIGQVIKEFSRLPYAGVLSHTILASREQSCINTAARESRDVSAYCKELISAGGLGCRFKDAMKPRYEKFHYLRNLLEEQEAVVFDMEEFVEALSSLQNPICPYFSSTRVLTQDADIIFCPFSYLVDPIIRTSSDVHLKNSIVILDEAHNIEDNCREAASFTFHEKEISDALVNIKEKEAMTLKLAENCSSGVNLMFDGVEKEAADAALSNYSQDLQYLTTLAVFVDDLFKWFRDSASKLLKQARNDSEGKLSITVNYAYLDVDLKTFHLHPDDARYRTVKTAYSELCSSDKEMQENRSVDIRPSSAATICIEKWLYFIGFFKEESKRSMYKMNVSSEKVYQYNERSTYIRGEARRDGQAALRSMSYNVVEGNDTDEWLSSTVGPGGHEPIRSGYKTSVNLWCMSPELAFTNAFDDCRSVILASGTLCPVETLKTELGMKFHSQMEGDQVIPAEQIFASVLPVGPSGHKLCATYRNVNDDNGLFISELALAVRTICMTVPRGILCFLPSYRMLTLLYEYMENTSILRQIQTRKVVVKEPRRSSDLPVVMEVFESGIRNPSSHGRHVDGALMFAVFRGKISEGIDFTDDLARLVISVGIPYPNAVDELVKEKRGYNDQFCKTKSLLSGDQWYVSQAYRALNQALGRCLRHRNDWGALVLVDERLAEQASNSQTNVVSSARVSKWIRKQLVVYPTFENFETSLSEFIRRMQLKDEERKFDQSF